MEISKTIGIDVGHRVPFHKGKCATPHGHWYEIEVFVDGEVIGTKGTSDEGMVIDFSDLKEVMMDVLDKKYDHNGVFYKDDPKRNAIIEFYDGAPKQVVFVDFVPTAENLAKHWFNELKSELEKRGVKIVRIIVWETRTSKAIYSE